MQKRLGTALGSYKKKRWGAVLSDGKGTGSKDVTDLIIYCMQTAMGMISTITDDQVSSIAAIWAIYHLMIMGPPEESVESQHSYCPNGGKTWGKYHKDKIFNRNIYDRSKCLPFVFRSELHVSVGPLKIRTSPLTT